MPCRYFIRLYGLSTCIHCRRARDFFENNKVAFDCVYVDMLAGEERKKTFEVVRGYNERVSFPTMVLNDGAAVLVGFHEEKLREMLGLRDEVRKIASSFPPPGQQAYVLLEKLRPIQEAKGYFFNKDGALVLELLRQLLVTKERYGYMSCPCRLASGDYGKDKDIICPCVYRESDVREFGSCRCNLYVCEDSDGKSFGSQSI